MDIISLKEDGLEKVGRVCFICMWLRITLVLSNREMVGAVLIPGFWGLYKRIFTLWDFSDPFPCSTMTHSPWSQCVGLQIAEVLVALFLG